jgi:hypothetical protein
LRLAKHSPPAPLPGPNSLTALFNRFEKATAVFAADLFNKTGRRRGSRFDCLIAATAILADAEIATANQSDFKVFVSYGLKIATAFPPPLPSTSPASTSAASESDLQS